MLELELSRNSFLQEFLFEHKDELSISTNSIEEKVKLLIVRDLFRLGWVMNAQANKLSIKPPDSYDKEIIKASMQIRRQELIVRNSDWINKNLDLAKQNLASGKDAWNSEIEPMIEICKSQEQLDIFRIFRFFWSSPYSEYVGRRIKLLVRDNALPNNPVIGIAALGSSIVHIPDRDKWVGWDKNNRTHNLVYTMDAYVLGALPPYNELLCGKLISYMIASKEVREIFSKKYKNVVTNISKRKANRLACIFTTSLYGNSSQYNRMKLDGDLLYIPVGQTKGYGTLHLTDETFGAMRELLAEKGIEVTNRFGDGPIWRMRVIRTVGDILGFDSDFLLKHSFQRQIYAIPLAHNYRKFLQGENRRLRYFNYSLDRLVDYWKERWLINRKKNLEVKDRIYDFDPANFSI